MEITPMIGGATGNTDGVIPGFELGFELGKWSFYSEQEYLIDLNDSKESFYYQWTDISYEILNWLNLGVSLQRLRPYQLSSGMDYGAFVELNWTEFSIGSYVFINRDESLDIIYINFEF